MVLSFSRGTTSPVTTMIAIGWSVTASYALFTSLWTNGLQLNVLSCAAALFPLAASWAVIERKRWGRLALLGMSLLALSAVLSAALQFLTHPVAYEQNLFQNALPLLGIRSNHTLGSLWCLLALLTGWWMSRRAVCNEFDLGKRKTLTRAQAVIATLIVGAWAAAGLLNNPAQASTTSMLATSSRFTNPSVSYRGQADTSAQVLNSKTSKPAALGSDCQSGN